MVPLPPLGMCERINGQSSQARLDENILRAHVKAWRCVLLSSTNIFDCGGTIPLKMCVTYFYVACTILNVPYRLRYHSIFRTPHLRCRHLKRSEAFAVCLHLESLTGTATATRRIIEQQPYREWNCQRVGLGRGLSLFCLIAGLSLRKCLLEKIDRYNTVQYNLTDRLE